MYFQQQHGLGIGCLHRSSASASTHSRGTSKLLKVQALAAASSEPLHAQPGSQGCRGAGRMLSTISRPETCFERQSPAPCLLSVACAAAECGSIGHADCLGTRSGPLHPTHATQPSVPPICGNSATHPSHCHTTKPAPSLSCSIPDACFKPILSAHEFPPCTACLCRAFHVIGLKFILALWGSPGAAGRG